MTTALLVIDVQESFRARADNWAGVSAPDIADRIDRLVRHARSRGDEVIWVLHTEPGSGTVFDPAAGHVRLLDPLRPEAGEELLSKTSHNCFTTTNLAQHLTARGVDHLVVTGLRTEQCCETTARLGSDLGYRISFVLDATATMPLPSWDGGPDLTTDEVITRTASALQGRFADVVTIEDVLADSDLMVRTVVFVVPARVHLLDLAGPAQAFTTANDHGGDYRLRYVGATPAITSHQGLPIAADTEWPPLTEADVVVLPGRRVGDRPPRQWIDRDSAGRVRGHHAIGGRVVSVCSGAFALAATGLLDGRRATTHHDIQRDLARRFPAVHVVHDVLFVVDGTLASSAGIASGIDLALHLIADDHGPAVAARVARALVVPMRRNGSAPQQSTMLQHRDHLLDTVHRVQDVLDTHFAEPLTLHRLADVGGVSERTLTRLFTAATGTTPLRYQQALRLERADHLVAQGWTLEATARAVGLSDARMLRRLRAERREARTVANG